MYILDHLHKLNWRKDAHEEGLKNWDRYSAFTAASGAFCDLARQHGNSSLILVQLGRPADKRKPEARPTLFELKETGALENDATGVIMVHWPEFYIHNKPELKGVMEVLVLKSRNGSVGDCKFNFRSSTVTFTDTGVPVEEEQDDPMDRLEKARDKADRRKRKGTDA